MARGERGAPHPRLENVRVDAYGFSARVFAKGAEREKRFPPGAEDAKIEQWQARTKSALLDLAAMGRLPKAPSTRGTFTGDVLAYLKRREGRDGYKSDRSHLKAWEKTFGKRARGSLTQEHCENLIATWRSAGRKEKTIRHRVRVFKELAHALDGKKAATPLDDVKLPKPVHANPKHVPAEVIRAVAESLRKGLTITQRCGPKRTKTVVHRATSMQTYARFLVRAVTGQRADQIMHATRSDVDLDARIWYVRPAKGGDPIPFPLENDEQVFAWQLFIAADAWGDWDWNSFAAVLRRHGWPKDIPPKNLRHAFAIDHLLNGTDIGDLQGLLGHASIQTTRDFYAPILVSRLKAAVTRRVLNVVPGGMVPGQTDGSRKFPKENEGKTKRRNRARHSLKSVKTG